MSDPTQHESHRLADGPRYRPGYPTPAAALLKEACGLSDGAPVADFGSGDGDFARLMLRQGLRVIAIEPDLAKREAGARQLRCYSLYQSWDGRAEETGLPDHTVEAVTIEQSLNRFSLPEARREFQRVLKPGGWVFMIWNDERQNPSPFQSSFEGLMEEFGSGSESVPPGPTREEFARFLGTTRFESRIFPNRQPATLEHLRLRLASTPDSPAPDSPYGEALRTSLERLFAQHQANGRVLLGHDTHVFWGHFAH